MNVFFTIRGRNKLLRASHLVWGGRGLHYERNYTRSVGRVAKPGNAFVRVGSVPHRGGASEGNYDGDSGGKQGSEAGEKIGEHGQKPRAGAAAEAYAANAMPFPC